MKETQIQRCPHCNSSNIGIGYQLGGGGLFADRYAYHSGARCSEIETYFCKNCGSVLLQKVKRPEIFEAAGTARGCENAQRMRKGPTGWSFGCKNLQDAEKWPYKAVFW